MITIDISDEFSNCIDPLPLVNSAQVAIDTVVQEEESDLTIVIDSDDLLQQLNREYLGIDTPTDVLSFPSGNEIDLETGRRYWGDIIISYPKAKSQAEDAGHSLQNELQLLVVHGALHLLGFDHDTKEQKVKMWSIQREILNQLGCVLGKEPGE
jgi:probable rRNA maturation factor